MPLEGWPFRGGMAIPPRNGHYAVEWRFHLEDPGGIAIPQEDSGGIKKLLTTFTTRLVVFLPS